jgi:NitT/TauT family transport system substrate-binding protein
MTDPRRPRRSLALAAALLAGTTLSSPAQAADPFVYAVPSAITSAIANFAFAMELGFFEEENIAPEFIPMSGSGVTIPQLLANQIQSTGASLEPLVIARVPGNQDFPLIFVYNYLRNSVWEFAVLEDSDIQSFDDLRGRTIGITSLTAGNIYSTQSIVGSRGIPWEEVETLPVGFGAQAFEALRTGQVDVLNLWDSMHQAMELAGIPFRRLELPPEFQGLSSHGFSVTLDMVENNPGLIERFGRAATKGAIACQANPEGCLRAYFRQFPDTMPADMDLDAAVAREMPIMLSRLANITFFRDGEEAIYGAFEDRDWEALIDSLRLGGVVPADLEIPLDTLYTNRFVEAYNDFDRDAVIALAQAYE